MQSDINSGGAVYINAIEFQWNGASSWTDAIKVYMGHTSKTVFSSSSDWVLEDDLTQVYDGAYTVGAAGWYRIDLSTPFYYNGTDNLVIAVDENTGSYHSYSSFYATSQGSSYRSIYYKSDSYNPNPACPPNGNRIKYRPNIKIDYHIPQPEDYTQWPYSAQISINTTGLSMSGDVLDFPLLLRLNSSNFDFTQAKSDGTDLRFARADNVHLTFERESFDAVNQTAEFWIKVTRVSPAEVQTITMYWGKSDATDQSMPSGVFSYENDFSGVWHCNESSGTVKDATVYANNGTFHGGLPDQADGYIDQAHDYDGNGDYISVDHDISLDMSANDRVTVSAWVKRHGVNVDNEWEGIAGKFDWDVGTEREYMLSNNQSSGQGFSFHVSSNGDASGETVVSANLLPTTNTWYLVTGVATGSNLLIYVNGTLKNSVSHTTGIAQENSAFEIGKIDDYGGTSARQYWHGIIDEVRVSKTARSADWIKLCYETQRLNQSIITIGPAGGDGYQVSAGTATGGTISFDPPGGTYAEGTTVTLTANPDAGFIFENWTGMVTSEENPLAIQVSGNMSITANCHRQFSLAVPG